jgi:hypothetical protein
MPRPRKRKSLTELGPIEMRPIGDLKNYAKNPRTHTDAKVIAAEQTGRSCLCLKISPACVDVSVERWQNFTGDAAVLEGDGRTFEEVGAERQQQAAAE